MTHPEEKHPAQEEATRRNQGRSVPTEQGEFMIDKYLEREFKAGYDFAKQEQQTDAIQFGEWIAKRFVWINDIVLPHYGFWYEESTHQQYSTEHLFDIWSKQKS